MPFPIAVVIPTYNRCDALRRCLEHLELQTHQQFEVVVIDDGSTDGTEAWMQEYLQQPSLSIQYFRQDNSGPARARNNAVAHVDAPITILIGDDIFPSPHFVETHLRMHDQKPDETVVGVGLTVWSETGQTVTPFMRWLDTDGMQFNYGELLQGTPPSWRHFYTSNLSLKTSFLRKFPFDETFKRYGLEDIELACRMEEAQGLTMVFLRDALAEHLHPTSFPDACRRIENVGESTAHFNTIRPGLFPRGKRAFKFRVARRIAKQPLILRALEFLADRSMVFKCPNRLMWLVFDIRFERGYARYCRQPT